jgi:hypothetical protein
MTHHNFLYALAGFAAGVVSVSVGIVMPSFLTIGVGPLFFAALVVAHSFRRAGMVRQKQNRYWLSLFVCTIGYILAFLTFNYVMAYSPDAFRVGSSGDVVQFRGDVWLGLVAAGSVAAVGLHVLTAVLVGARRPTVFRRAVISSVVAILTTYLINLHFHNYWSFMGALLPIGEGLFGLIAGSELDRVEVATPDSHRHHSTTSNIV